MPVAAAKDEWVRVIHLSMIACSFLVCSCATTGTAPSHDDPESSTRLLVSHTDYDIDNDGSQESIEILLTEGERYDDTQLWQGNGEKWEGQFQIEVRKGDRLLSAQSLGKLMRPWQRVPDPLFFWTPEFALVLSDYNGDGQMDFNLGTYAGSSGNVYQLFTIGSDGAVAPLPVADRKYGILVSDGGARDNSSQHLRLEDGFVKVNYHDNSDKHNGMYDRMVDCFTAWYQWDGTQFVLAREEPRVR
jgi:hypothetical protein